MIQHHRQHHQIYARNSHLHGTARAWRAALISLQARSKIPMRKDTRELSSLGSRVCLASCSSLAMSLKLLGVVPWC